MEFEANLYPYNPENHIPGLDYGTHTYTFYGEYGSVHHYMFRKGPVDPTIPTCSTPIVPAQVFLPVVTTRQVCGHDPGNLSTDFTLQFQNCKNMNGIKYSFDPVYGTSSFGGTYQDGEMLNSPDSTAGGSIRLRLRTLNQSTGQYDEVRFSQVNPVPGYNEYYVFHNYDIIFNYQSIYVTFNMYS